MLHSLLQMPNKAEETTFSRITSVYKWGIKPVSLSQGISADCQKRQVATSVIKWGIIFG